MSMKDVNFDKETSKGTIRRSILEQRKSMSAFEVSEKSSNIVRQILETEAYKNTECIYAYISTRNEVDLKELIETSWAHGKSVAVPRVCGQNMDFYYIRSYADLEKGNFGILEPVAATVKAEDKDALMFIPGVAYDRAGNRIGYGGGYYDRYLAQEHNHYIIAPAYDFQIIDSLPAEEHDIRVNETIS